MIVKEMEEKLEDNRFDLGTRDQLAYYARDKWRSRFLFENACAVRLQQFVRERRMIWKAQAPLRSRYLAKAVDLYQKYLRRQWDPENRKAILKLTTTRFCPTKHIIQRVRLVILEQDTAANCMRRAYKAYRGRKAIREGIINTKKKRASSMHNAAVLLQCMTRQRLSRKAILKKKRRRAIVAAAATIVQRYFRWRRTTFQHAVTRIKRRLANLKNHARNTIMFTLSYQLKRFIQAKRRKKKLAEQARLKEEARSAFRLYMER